MAEDSEEVQNITEDSEDGSYVEEEFTDEELILPICKYEYLNHTAGSNIQLHSWGDSLKEAFEQCGIAMFGHVTDLHTVKIKESSEIEATGHDLESLLFQFLDKLLFSLLWEPFLICTKLSITEFVTEGEEMSLKCKSYGEEFMYGKHPFVNDVTEITSAMRIVNEPEKNKFELFVTIDT